MFGTHLIWWVFQKSFSMKLYKTWGYVVASFNILFDQGCTKPGVYGNSCNTPCPIHCKNNDCNIKNGTCYECDPGWKGTTCQISILTVLCYNYCWIIVVRSRPMFVSFMGNPCQRIYIPTNIYTITCLIFIKIIMITLPTKL
mgnify:CR=1 FL=1